MSVALIFCRRQTPKLTISVIVSIEHSGNRSYRNLVAKRAYEFKKARDHAEKERIVYEIINIVKARGGRFLRKLSKSESSTVNEMFSGVSKDQIPHNVYVLVQHESVVTKTKQAFRYCYKNFGESPPAEAAGGPDTTVDVLSRADHQQDCDGNLSINCSPQLQVNRQQESRPGKAVSAGYSINSNAPSAVKAATKVQSSSEHETWLSQLEQTTYTAHAASSKRKLASGNDESSKISRDEVSQLGQRGTHARRLLRDDQQLSSSRSQEPNTDLFQQDPAQPNPPRTIHQSIKQYKGAGNRSIEGHEFINSQYPNLELQQCAHNLNTSTASLRPLPMRPLCADALRAALDGPGIRNSSPTNALLSPHDTFRSLLSETSSSTLAYSEQRLNALLFHLLQSLPAALPNSGQDQIRSFYSQRQNRTSLPTGVDLTDISSMIHQGGINTPLNFLSLLPQSHRSAYLSMILGEDQTRSLFRRQSPASSLTNEAELAMLGSIIQQHRPNSVSAQEIMAGRRLSAGINAPGTPSIRDGNGSSEVQRDTLRNGLQLIQQLGDPYILSGAMSLLLPAPRARRETENNWASREE